MSSGNNDSDDESMPGGFGNNNTEPNPNPKSFGLSFGGSFSFGSNIKPKSVGLSFGGSFSGNNTESKSNDNNEMELVSESYLNGKLFEEDYQTLSSQNLKRIVGIVEIQIESYTKIPYVYDGYKASLSNRKKTIDNSMRLEEFRNVEDASSMLGGSVEKLRTEKSVDYKLAVNKLTEYESDKKIISTSEIAKKIGFYNIVEFINNVVNIYKELSPEERGRLLITMIFGGLITKIKVSSNTFKNVSAGLTKISDFIKELPRGGHGGKQLPAFKLVENLIKSEKLSKYRAEEQTIKQIDFIFGFLRRVETYPVYIPNMSIDVEGNSININNEITFDSLKKYFEPKKPGETLGTTKKLAKNTSMKRDHTNLNKDTRDDDYDDFGG